MTYPFLATKLFLPPLRPDSVVRPRLVEKLNGCLLPGRKLALVSAPPGFGKSTLAAEWAQQSQVPVAWIALDDGDNDPVRLWRYILAALQTISPEAGGGMLEGLQSSQPPLLTSLISLLINDLSAAKFLLVLDDYHLIESTEIHESLNFFLDYLPPGGRLALLTRADPPLHLARRRVKGEICEVRAADLRFSPEEIVSFLTGTMALDLPDAQIKALQDRTEGWIAGLQLAAISLQGVVDSQSLVSAFAGDDRYIADYLVEEVLQRQPEHIRSFLLKTSILTRMNTSLCDDLLDQSSTGDLSSRAILSYLEQSNIFLISLDNRREWFRYHNLFAELLRRNLIQAVGQGEVRDLYFRASEWHRRNNEPIQAVEYALASQDFERAAVLIQQVLPLVFWQGELTTATRWAVALPAVTLQKFPILCLGFGWAANATNQYNLQEILLRLVEKWAGITGEEFFSLDPFQAAQLSDEKIAGLVELSVQRARLALESGDTRAILDRYIKILPYLTPDRDSHPFLFNKPTNLRAPMSLLTALAYEKEGDIQSAAAGFAEAAHFAISIDDNPFVVALASAHQGLAQILMGKLREAEATFRRALEQAAEKGRQNMPFYGVAHAGLGMLAYEHNDIETAKREFEHGIRIGQVWNNWEAIIPCYLGLARLYLAVSDGASAFEILDRLEGMVQTGLPAAVPLIDTIRAGAWLRVGQVDKTAAWARKAGFNLDGDLHPPGIDETLVLARLLVAKGRSEIAARLLEENMSAAAGKGLWGEWVRLGAARLMCYFAHSQKDQLLNFAGKLLEYAAPEDYTRVFLDEGPEMARVLSLYIESRGPESACATRILAQLPTSGLAILPQPSQPGLVEPLSQRELEVLHLLAGGDSNAEIAAKAYITVNTVKKHITSIYGKLGVSTRLMAVERARALGLLD